MLGFFKTKLGPPTRPSPPQWIDWSRDGCSQETTQPTNNADDDKSDSSESAEDADDSDDWAPFGPAHKRTRVRREVTDSEDETIDDVAGKARLAHLVGRTVAKAFSGGIIFRGEIVRVEWVETTQSHMLSVRYTDGDTEHMTEEEVLEHVADDWVEEM